MGKNCCFFSCLDENYVVGGQEFYSCPVDDHLQGRNRILAQLPYIWCIKTRITFTTVLSWPNLIHFSFRVAKITYFHPHCFAAWGKNVKLKWIQLRHDKTGINVLFFGTKPINLDHFVLLLALQMKPEVIYETWMFSIFSQHELKSSCKLKQQNWSF